MALYETAVPPPAQAGRYQTLYIDDPWPERGAGKIKRGADRHYDLLSVDDIFALPIGRWAAPDAHCYMWATNNYLQVAFAVMQARGFRYVTTVTWIKDRQGLGQYFRGRTEHCLFGVRGRLPYRIAADGGRAQGETVLYYPDPSEWVPEPAELPGAFEAPRTRHSAKPPQMRAYCELVSHGPRLECFARQAADGWDAWGNQAPGV